MGPGNRWDSCGAGFFQPAPAEADTMMSATPRVPRQVPRVVSLSWWAHLTEKGSAWVSPGTRMIDWCTGVGLSRLNAKSF